MLSEAHNMLQWSRDKSVPKQRTRFMGRTECQGGTVMKLTIDTQGKTFTVTKEAGEKQDQNGRQKTDRNTGEPLWTVQVMALDATGGEMLNVTVAGARPKLAVGTAVGLVELEAIPWATNGKNGVAFRATQITQLGATKAA